MHEDEPRFVWKVGRFKSLTAETEAQRAAILSFGTSLAQIAIRAAPPQVDIGLGARELRQQLLAARGVVDFGDLLSLCWGVGIPVLYLRVFPLQAKHMCAMAIPLQGRHAVLLARDTKYPAQAAFYLAHELGHIALGHLAYGAIVDIEDPLRAKMLADPEEEAANRFALELLTGEAEPSILPAATNYTARSLAESAMAAASHVGIDAGTLVLCLAHGTGRWDKAMAALNLIYPSAIAIAEGVNRIAASQLEFSALSEENIEFLSGALGLT